MIAIDGFTWGVLGHVYGQPGTDPATLEKALDEVQSSAWSLPFYTLPLAWIAGMIMLAVGAAREGAVPGWAAGLLVVAAVLAGTETAVIDNTYFIVGAATLLAGGTAVAVPIARMSDEAYSAGGSGPPLAVPRPVARAATPNPHFGASSFAEWRKRGCFCCSAWIRIAAASLTFFSSQGIRISTRGRGEI